MRYHTDDDLKILEKEHELFNRMKELEKDSSNEDEYLKATKDWREFREKYPHLFMD